MSAWKVWAVAGVAMAAGLVALAAMESSGPVATELVVRNWHQMLRRNLGGDNSIGLHSLRAKAAFSALGSLETEVDQLQEQYSPKLKNADAKFSEAFGKLSTLERLSKHMKQARLRAMAEKPAGSKSQLQSAWQTATVEEAPSRRSFPRESAHNEANIALPPYVR